MNVKYIGAAAALSATLFSTGCGGGGLSSGTTSSSGTGLQVSLIDAPGNYEHVYVTVSSVSAVDGSGTETVLNSQSQNIDLLTLQNVSKVIGSAGLPVGQYSQIRLTVSSASLVDNSGVTHTLVVPSGSQTGIKLVDNFTITANQTTAVTLDFNAAQSIVQAGNASSPQGIKYLLKPVIKVVATVTSGQIGGTVSDSVTSSPIVSTDNPTVTAYPAGSATDGTVPASASSPVSATDGSYSLAKLAPGNYDVYFTADNYTQKVVTGVAVTANNTTSENASLVAVSATTTTTTTASSPPPPPV